MIHFTTNKTETLIVLIIFILYNKKFHLSSTKIRRFYSAWHDLLIFFTKKFNKIHFFPTYIIPPASVSSPSLSLLRRFSTRFSPSAFLKPSSISLNWTDFFGSQSTSLSSLFLSYKSSTTLSSLFLSHKNTRLLFPSFFFLKPYFFLPLPFFFSRTPLFRELSCKFIFAL